MGSRQTRCFCKRCKLFIRMKPPLLRVVSDDFPLLHAMAIMRVYDDAGKVIEAHKHAGDFKEP